MMIMIVVISTTPYLTDSGEHIFCVLNLEDALLMQVSSFPQPPPSELWSWQNASLKAVEVFLAVSSSEVAIETINYVS